MVIHNLDCLRCASDDICVERIHRVLQGCVVDCVIYCRSLVCAATLDIKLRKNTVLTVVVPTMWKFPPFPDFLNRMLDYPCVHQVILVNNQSEHTPSHPVIDHPGLKMLDFGRNIFVNPSWNTGVYHSQTELVCIANDDILFDLKLFDLVEKEYQPHMGCVGLHGACTSQAEAFLEVHQHQPCFGFGQLMFVSQKNWVDIPPELLVFFGDNWIFDTHKQKLGSNYFISNLTYHTPHAQSTQSQAWRLDQEREIYTQLTDLYQIHRWHE